LADNLESATYEVFENDRIKYDIYEDSLYKAYLDKKKYGRFLQTKAISGLEELKTDDQEEIVVMYFGAGRGPLIRKAFRAAERA
jgi:protein arginine N-methyltransferase 5